MYIYIDESGNSGININDVSQPYFYTLSLISESDFENKIKCQMANIRKNLNCNELHGNELGISKIDSIAETLLSIIKKYSISFNLSIIEKNYIPLASFVDVLFDSFDNKAVPWHIYNILELRGLLLLKLYPAVNKDILYKFWTGCIHENNTSKACKNFSKICEAVIKNISSIQDTRCEQIVSEAMEWAQKNPSQFFPQLEEKKLKLMASPNFISFTLQLPQLCNIAIEKNTTICSIIHDEQAQFGNTFKFYYDSSQKSGKVKLPPYFAQDSTLNFAPLKECNFIMKSSLNCEGLQLADVFLFLIKKHLEGKDITGKAQKLLEYILENTYVNQFTFSSFIDMIGERLVDIYSRPISREDVEKGKELLKEIEARRILAMQEQDTSSQSESVTSPTPQSARRSQ